MNSFLCLLLLLPTFITSFVVLDPTQELLAEEKRFAPFSVAQFLKVRETTNSTGIDWVDALEFACKTLFCHLQDDKSCNDLCVTFSREFYIPTKSYDVITGAYYKTPTKNYADCVDRFVALSVAVSWNTTVVGINRTILEGLCHAAYKCKDHQAYELQLIKFFDYYRGLQVKTFVNTLKAIAGQVDKKRFEPFPVDKYIQADIAIAGSFFFNDDSYGNQKEQTFNLGCKTLFCHLKEDKKCNDLCARVSKQDINHWVHEKVTTGRYDSDSEADCVDNYFARKFNSTHMKGLCAFAYQCKEHQLYELKYREFAQYLREYNATAPAVKIQLDEILPKVSG